MSSEDAVELSELALGPESSIVVGWQKKEEKCLLLERLSLAQVHLEHQLIILINSLQSLMGLLQAVLEGMFNCIYPDIKFLDLEASLKSCIFTTLEIEVGGGRKISQFGTVRMLYSVGSQGIFRRFELHRGGQELIVPILLSRHLNAVIATGALVIPASIYFLLKTFIVKPYYHKWEKHEVLANMKKTAAQVREARAAAEKARQLLQNVANRKKNKQLEPGGLVIAKAVYGSQNALKKKGDVGETKDELASQVIDVTLSLNFLANDSGQLKLHEGVKKSGIMGFCDPCPEEPKQLHVEYTCHGEIYDVVVDDYEELLIPHAAHKI